MSTPTDQFGQLTLESPLQSSYTVMAPLEDIRARAVLLQDILSSFDTTELPSEFQPNIFYNIEHNLEMPSGIGRSHTISGNLRGTLLQWGAYDEKAWEWLSQLQTPELRARLYYEKVQRRFDACFDAYDLLFDNPPTSTTLKVSLQRIIEDFVKLSSGLSTDRERREQMDAQPIPFEAQTVEKILQALQKTCERAQPIIAPDVESSRRSTRRTASANLENLYGMLIRQADEDEPFLLYPLEQFSTPALRQCLESLRSLDALLRSAKAPEFYIARFEALKRKANEEIQPVPGVGAGGSSGRGRGRGSGREADTDLDPKPGQKRPNQAVETAPKRGRRAGGR